MSDDQWYWDLTTKQPVPSGERDATHDLLGPYPTRHDAENWKSTAEARDEAWSDEDERWSGDGDAGSDEGENGDGPPPGTSGGRSW